MIRLIDHIRGPRIQERARAYVQRLARAQESAAYERCDAFLRSLSSRPGPHVVLGEADWGSRTPVRVPLGDLVRAHAMITGGTGSGKTMSALAIVETILASPGEGASFGVLDAKGELFERTLYLIERQLRNLPPDGAERLRDRLVIIDLSSQDPVTSYDIARPWTNDLNYFATNRVETLKEVLPSGDGFSVRGELMIKNAIQLLAERSLPFSYVEHVFSSDDFRKKLLDSSGNAEVKSYFKLHFPAEGRAAKAAVSARIVSSLLSSASLRLALAGSGAPDFRRLQDSGNIVLVNCAGPNIPMPTARTLQALILSDIRQTVFARTNDRPFLWFCDEAQNFFATKHLRENMKYLLTMSRSFGTFFLYLTQNISSAVQDADMLETLQTNIRWSLSMRGTPRDASFLLPAFPITGRRERPRRDPFGPVEYYSLNEERNLMLNEMAQLADRTGWLLFKTQQGDAMRIHTRTIDLLAGSAFKECVSRIRSDARLGCRMPRALYMSKIAERDGEWLSAPATDVVESFRSAAERNEAAGHADQP